MPTDIEIAQAATPRPISEIAAGLGIPPERLVAYGSDKAKVDYNVLREEPARSGKLVLVTAINPTPAGEGKTTVTIGLADALRRLGTTSVVALREPRAGVWHQRRCGGWWLCPSYPNGGYQLTLHRRFSCNWRGEQPACGSAR